MKKQVRVLNGALDVDSERNDIILRGRLDPDCLEALLVDDYQREILPAATIREIMPAVETGEVPDIDLGMRGENCRSEKDGSYVLHDPVYIVDGLQRTTAARQLQRAS